MGVFPKLGVPFLGVPMIRIIAFWCLHWSALILGNCLMTRAIVKVQPNYKNRSKSHGELSSGALGTRIMAFLDVGYCPQPVTVYTRGLIKGSIYKYITNTIQVLQSGGSTQPRRSPIFWFQSIPIRTLK